MVYGLFFIENQHYTRQQTTTNDYKRLINGLVLTGFAFLQHQNSYAMEYKISQFKDQNGSPFIEAPDGSIDFGQITIEQRLTPAPIRLALGDKENGLVHIEIRHGNQIRKAGFASVVAFVDYVAKNYNRIKKGNSYETSMGNENQTYLVQLTDEHNNTLWVQLSRDESYWNVNSAGVLSKRYGRNKENIWSASELQNEEPASSNTSQPATNADKEAGSNGTVSDVSDGKDTTFSTHTSLF